MTALELDGLGSRILEVKGEALGTVLEDLRQKGFVRRLEPLPGARAPQWEQIVAAGGKGPSAGGPAARTTLGEGALPVARTTPPSAPTASVPLAGASAPRPFEARVAALEAEVAELRRRCLHAKVEIAAHDRGGLERLCRYLARPPIATERLSLAEDGRVVYALRRHWKDGTRAFVFDPLDFIARLAALVPRPRTHLLTYHGVLAPAAEWRDWIVPGRGAPPAESPARPWSPRPYGHTERSGPSS